MVAIFGLALVLATATVFTTIQSAQAKAIFCPCGVHDTPPPPPGGNNVVNPSGSTSGEDGQGRNGNLQGGAVTPGGGFHVHG